MNDPFETYVQFFNALSDKKRLMIVDMLSYGELSGRHILGKFQITQPTLSHHMKILCSCGLVQGRKEGKWIYYSLNKEEAKDFKEFLNTLTKKKNG
jgi:ArsR family transcriptional regulator